MKILDFLKVMFCCACSLNAAETKGILDLPGIPEQIRSITIDHYTFLSEEEREIYKNLPPLKYVVSGLRSLQTSETKQVDIEKIKEYSKRFYKNTLEESEFGTFLYSIAEKMIDNGNYTYTNNSLNIGGVWELNVSEEDNPPFTWSGDIKYLVDELIFCYDGSMLEIIKEACKGCSEDEVNEWIRQVTTKFKDPLNSKINVIYNDELSLFSTMVHETGHALEIAYMSKFCEEKNIRPTECTALYFEMKSHIYAKEQGLFDNTDLLNLLQLWSFYYPLLSDFKFVLSMYYKYPENNALNEFFDNLLYDTFKSGLDMLIDLTEDTSSQYFDIVEQIEKNENFIEQPEVSHRSLLELSNESYLYATAKAFEMIKPDISIDNAMKAMISEDHPPLTSEGVKYAVDCLIHGGKINN